MLYVFHVDVGRMMSFDMAVALSSVENLKETIERVHGLPSKNIVLLVSGGEMLNQTTQVSYYSAGTDTNPIYMFLIEENRDPADPKNEQKNDQKNDKKKDQKAEEERDLEFVEQIERCKLLPTILSSVEKRTQLAMKIYEIARDDERFSERLVYEQHLQQQGWWAVVANMEDLIEEFRQRFVKFCAAFEQHLEQRAKHIDILHTFSDGLRTLSRIPILPSLMSLAEEDFHGFDCFLDADDVFSRSHSQQKSVLVAGGVPAQQTVSDGQPAETETAENDGDDNAIADDRSSTSPNKKQKMGTEVIEEASTTISPMTVTDKQSSSSNSSRPLLNLLQWITSKENQRRLETMCDECIQGLNTFDHNVYLRLQDEAQHILKQAEQPEIREIKGLSERLSRLDQIIIKIRNTVGQQKELCTSFQQNQTRANHLRDPSILPDLCLTHQEQLIVMNDNYQKIRYHRRLISKAKEELGTNLHARLSRMVHVENSMSEFDNRLLFYLKCVRRAERHLQVMEQIHQAPCMYMAAVTEVVRRKIFSQEFRLWATKLADDFDTIHNEEISRRRQFNANFEGHFLNKLFPGMNDMPPAFANEIPLLFDAHLPNINKSDIDMLTSHLPDLAQGVKLPDMRHVINFFVSRSGPHQKLRLEELLGPQLEGALGNPALAEEVPQISEMGTGEKPLLHQRLADLQKIGDGCEGSETDTENEFENLAVATDETLQSATQCLLLRPRPQRS
ncbi:unnamed protein product [Ceratitis capitata]|uniref:RB1-inducible coiled-coil protein 1 n=1 Tax=Ceratitis capitata TaxID=7213 RepID=A0A811UCQ1_CERCA|nr:unnamed protein product [Ceratitis capitata]